MKKQNTYTPELRQEAVKLVLTQGLTLDEAAVRLTIPKGTLGTWVSAAKRGNGPKAAPGSRTVAELETKPVLHGDNGATLKATTVLAMLHWLGVKPSYSRPRVSDDNAFAESLFRTAKYRPEFPSDGFEDIDGARAWAVRFTHWYNFEHKHSGIQYVSPAQRHAGEDHAILEARHAVYMAARTRNPARWSGATRNWAPIGPVTLNPERDSVVNLAASMEGIDQKAA